MFGIGLPEMIVIMAVALIVVGPDKLPELARSLAKGLNEFKKTMNQVKENFSEESKIISSVQEDLKKTTGAMAGKLLDNDPQIWTREDDINAGDNPDDDIIEVDTINEERPWEKDALQEPGKDAASETELPPTNVVRQENDTSDAPSREEAHSSTQ
ncbi:MAG: twin-arginine translocase subunit TatB [Desulfobulbus sp.]|nr:MAG: twin-arginine translocase subunit TatB [Desulfobulbus sp.]